METLHRKFSDVAQNCKVKEYPCFYELCVASRNFFLPDGWEEDKPKYSAGLGETDSEELLRRSIRRARIAIKDIALCNSFSHFATLTLDKCKINRYSWEDIIPKVNRWLSNCVQRKGMTYVIVPELHKDGAVHFHGLLRGDGLSFLDSGKRTGKGQMITNLREWRFGFSACIPLEGEYEKVCNYIMKYITKDTVKIGGRWYLSGGDLKKPIESITTMPYEDVPSEPRRAPMSGVSFKYLRIDKNA